MGELKENYTPKNFIMNTMQSENPWAIHKESRERLEQYYEGKKQVLADIEQKVLSYDPTKVDEQQQKHQRKLQWVKDFIKDYEVTEEETAYAFVLIAHYLEFESTFYLLLELIQTFLNSLFLHL